MLLLLLLRDLVAWTLGQACSGLSLSRPCLVCELLAGCDEAIQYEGDQSVAQTR